MTADSVAAARDMARRFAARDIAPLAAKTDADNEFPRPLWRKLGEAGLLGVTVGEQYGGAGMGYVAHCAIMEEISRASASVGLSYSAHSNLCANQIYLHGSEEQRSAFLPGLCSGERVGALAMSEHGSGSDVMSMAARAEKKGGAYVLNGGKMWITNGPSADIIVVYARTSESKNGITAFIVEGNNPGLSRSEKIDKLGMRGSDTGELTFRDCEVPASAMLGEENKGAAVLMSGLDFERIVLAAGPLGIMAAALDLALDYAGERRQFGGPISGFQLVRAKLADMYTALSASRALVLAVAEACDRGSPSRRDAAAAILFASESATRCALEAVQILGANGYTKAYPAERLLRDAKLYEIGAGTSEIRRLLIGRELAEKGI